MGQDRLRNRSIRIKYKDLVVIQTVMGETDLDEKEQGTKERIDRLIEHMQRNTGRPQVASNK